MTLKKREHHLETPVSESDLANLHVGDLAYISGKLFTIRDLAHKRIGEYARAKKKIPFDLKGGAIFHCGPILKKIGPNQWQAVAAGPTSSSRFSPFVRPVLEWAGPKIIVGKGSLFPEAYDAVIQNHAVYMLGVGGCAALYAAQITSVVNAYWEEFGMVDTVWEFEINRFGPLTVGIDLDGKNYIEDMKGRLKENLSHIYDSLEIDPNFTFTWWPQVPAGTKRATEYSTT
jgi:tartrate/fumarate subfamily iron-sulfur-dependent hydro-lyase beta chain